LYFSFFKFLSTEKEGIEMMANGFTFDQ